MTGASLGYSGYYDETSLYLVGIGTVRWSSTISSASTSFDLAMNASGRISPQYNDLKKYGHTVRCAEYPVYA